MKNTVFAAILVFFFFQSCWSQGSFIVFQFHDFVLVCFFLVLFVSISDIWFVLCCVCVVWLFSFFYIHRTKWFCCLYLVVIFPFFVLFWILSFLFFHSSQKKTPQKTGHSKNPKKQKCRKKRTKKKTVSAVVFTNSVLQFFGVGLQFSFFGWKHYKDSGFGIFLNR